MTFTFKSTSKFLEIYNALILECANPEEYSELVIAVLTFANLAKRNLRDTGVGDLEALIKEFEITADELAQKIVDSYEKKGMVN